MQEQNSLLMDRWHGTCSVGVMCGFLSLPICPFTEVHPLLGVKGDGKSKKKQAGRPKGSKGKEKDSPFKPKLYKGTEVYLWKDQRRVKCRRSSASP